MVNGYGNGNGNGNGNGYNGNGHNGHWNGNGHNGNTHDVNALNGYGNNGNVLNGYIEERATHTHTSHGNTGHGSTGHAHDGGVRTATHDSGFTSAEEELENRRLVHSLGPVRSRGDTFALPINAGPLPAKVSVGRTRSNQVNRKVAGFNGGVEVSLREM